MRNFTIAALLLCSLSLVSISESYTVEVQPGHEVTLMCSNFSSAPTQIYWFKVVNKTQPDCIAHMFSLDSVRLCKDVQKGKFEMRSNISTVFLTIKQVDLSDSGLYFCGYFMSRNPVLVDATYLEVQEMFHGLTSVILATLAASLFVVVICLAVKIAKLQRAHVGGQNPQENCDSDDVNYAALTFRPKQKRNQSHAAAEVATVIYGAPK